MPSSEYKIIIVGRTNVGKSTLFNRIVGKREAIAFDRPGVTVDIKEKKADIWGKELSLLDTPGMFGSEQLTKAERAQIQSRLAQAILAADLVLLVTDGLLGLVEEDREIAKFLKQSEKEVIIVVNKCEKASAEQDALEATELGFETIITISAKHGLNIHDLYAKIVEHMPRAEPQPAEDSKEANEIKIAIVGKPNAGKSTLINKILGRPLQLESSRAGTTRESNSFPFVFQSRRLCLVDTPGIRRLPRIQDQLEKISRKNALDTYNQVDIVIIVIDACSIESELLDQQNIKLIEQAKKAGRGIIIAINKIDLADINLNFDECQRYFQNIEVVYISAINSKNIMQLLEKVIETSRIQASRFTTSSLNRWLCDLNNTDIIKRSSFKFKMKYVTQLKSNPPTILIMTARPQNISESIRRYISNNLKDYFGLLKISLNIVFRSLPPAKPRVKHPTKNPKLRHNPNKYH
jgi:GTP-binding protein